MTMKRKLNTSDVRTLAARLELERSSLLCAQLAQALGYRLRGKPGCVQVDRPGGRLLAVYFSADVLIDDLLQDARRLVGRW